MRLIGGYLNGFFFGHGERAWVLALNLAFSALLVFPLLFYFLKGGLVSDGANASVGPADVIWFSVRSILPTFIDTAVRAGSGGVRVCAAIESLWGLIIAGLFVSYMLRWILRR